MLITAPREKLIVVKIGGNVIDNEESLNKFLNDFSKITQKKILVHGGGKIATEIASRLGIEAVMVEGRRVTDRSMLDIVTMVYGGLINKNIVAKLQSFGNNALGLSGADGNSILCAKRPVKDIDYGFVGDVKDVNSDFLTNILDGGLIPVMSPLSHDGAGNMLNINADTVATTLSKAMSKNYDVTLLYCFELKGVLSDFENKDSVIPQLNFDSYHDLKHQGVISKGMIPKMDNSFDAIKNGVSKVVICHSDNMLMASLGEETGTVLA
ncbi:MAG: acetylglutamate kinase [Opitutaceae bacterium]|nr:acetylglutamate kinase [Cytophagales bacterium]